MKRLIMFPLIILLVTVGCSSDKRTDYDITFFVPAGWDGGIVFSEEELTPLGDEIVMTPGEGLDNTPFLLQETEGNVRSTYAPSDFTYGQPVTRGVVKNVWYRLGILAENRTDKDAVYKVNVKDVEIRIKAGVE